MKTVRTSTVAIICQINRSFILVGVEVKYLITEQYYPVYIPVLIDS